MGRELSLLGMRDHAAMLAAAACRLVEERVRADGRAGSQTFPLAALVMRALAVEVGMKGLIARAQGFSTGSKLLSYIGKSAQGHDLEHLYKMLPARSKNVIRRHVASVPRMPRYIAIATGERMLEWVDAELGPNRKRTFEEELSRLGKPFVQWRYGYEHDFLACNVTFLELLTDATLIALQKAIRSGKSFVEKSVNSE